jgi:hypothetical protein
VWWSFGSVRKCLPFRAWRKRRGCQFAVCCGSSGTEVML